MPKFHGSLCPSEEFSKERNTRILPRVTSSTCREHEENNTQDHANTQKK